MGNNICDKFQSGLRKNHSTETALLRVMKEILMDQTLEIPLLFMQSYSTDLEAKVGRGGTALNWFSSYLEDRVFRVTMNNCTSLTSLISYGVPQGSFLGPTLFSLYLFPLCHVICPFTPVLYHCYADDSQIYVSFKNGNHKNLDSLLPCCH